MFPILTYFTISGGDITTMLGYTGDLVGDFLPLILVFIGISIAFMIYRLTRGHN